MPDVQSFLRPPEGFRSREAALFFAQLEDQTLYAASAGASAR